MKGIWKEIMQKIKVNNRFATFPTMIKHEKHIDNRAKPSENSDELIPWLFGKKFGDKVFISHKKVHEMLSFKMRNLRALKKDTFDQQSRGFFQSPAFRSSRRRCFIKKLAIIISKNHRKTPVSVFF